MCKEKIASQLLYGNHKEKIASQLSYGNIWGKKLRHNFWNGITNEKVLYHSDVEILDKKISVKKRDYNLEKFD